MTDSIDHPVVVLPPPATPTVDDVLRADTGRMRTPELAEHHRRLIDLRRDGRLR